MYLELHYQLQWSNSQQGPRDIFICMYSFYGTFTRASMNNLDSERIAAHLDCEDKIIHFVCLFFHSFINELICSLIS